MNDNITDWRIKNLFSSFLFFQLAVYRRFECLNLMIIIDKGKAFVKYSITKYYLLFLLIFIQNPYDLHSCFLWIHSSPVISLDPFQPSHFFIGCECILTDTIDIFWNSQGKLVCVSFFFLIIYPPFFFFFKNWYKLN